MWIRAAGWICTSFRLATLLPYPEGVRPVALRPALSSGLPFSNFHYVNTYSINRKRLSRKKGYNMKSLTPLQNIRTHCMWCCLDQVLEVRMCPAQKCPSWPFRLGRLPAQGSRSALKAIRARCLDCVGWSVKDVAECKNDCALNVYRFGKRVNVSEAYREQARTRARVNPLFKKTTTGKPISETKSMGNVIER
jgi:hypothetical protein